MKKIEFSFSASIKDTKQEEIKDAGMMSCKVDFPEESSENEINRQCYGVAYDEVTCHFQDKFGEDLFDQLEEVIISISDLKVENS